MPEHHKVPVIRIIEILPHPNADRLEIVRPLGAYQCVVQKGQFKIGDLAVFVPPDSVVPERDEFKFVWERDGGGNLRDFPPDEPIPEKYRRVTVRKFRREWSEGLLLPISDFCLTESFHKNPGWGLVSEDDDVSERLGIYHYNPPEDPDQSILRTNRKQYKKLPRSLKGWIYFLTYWLTFGFYDLNGNVGGANEKPPSNAPPVYDVESLKNHSTVFATGELVSVTEKIHGSNARFTYRDSPTRSFLRLQNVGKMYAGSRKLWKRSGGNIWRQLLKTNPEIERFCRDYPGYTLYGEAVPTQKDFDYGATKESPRFFAFDILDPDGKWVERETFGQLLGGYDIEKVPTVFYGEFSYDSFVHLADGPTQVPNGKHIREGIVIKAVPERRHFNFGRAQLKIIGNEFLAAQK